MTALRTRIVRMVLYGRYMSLKNDETVMIVELMTEAAASSESILQHVNCFNDKRSEHIYQHCGHDERNRHDDDKRRGFEKAVYFPV